MVNSPLNNYFLASALVYLLLLFGCGADETVSPPLGDANDTDTTLAPTSSPYYPIALGNRWIYRNPDGSEWEHTITRKEAIGGFKLLCF